MTAACGAATSCAITWQVTAAVTPATYRAGMSTATVAPTGSAASVGPLLREWRARRRVSQLELSAETGVSTRHLSFIETGRARPSRDMVMRLADYLDVPLRERNSLLLAAGFAPEYAQTPLDAESMRGVRRSLQALVDAHQPCPAFAVDHGWNLVLANDVALSLVDGLPDELFTDPLNVMRMTLHPLGMRSRIINFDIYSAQLLHRLHRDERATGDASLRELIRECESYPGVTRPIGMSAYPIAPVLKMRLAPDGPTLSFFTIVSTLGTPSDVTLDEIAIESFFPADAETADAIGMRA
jgi:transcriptional regulator with XRE-family HTH domain